MTLFGNIKPVLVAGFFLSAPALGFAQQIVPANPAFEPEPAAALPPTNGDSPVVPFGRTRATLGDDTGSLVIRLQQLEEEIRRLNGIVEEQQLRVARQHLRRKDEPRALAAREVAHPAVRQLAAAQADGAEQMARPQLRALAVAADGARALRGGAVPLEPAELPPP